MAPRRAEGQHAVEDELSSAGGREHGYPRPQLRRAGWTSLNGTWAFALDPEARWRRPGDVAWDRDIEVPFSPETEQSGIGEIPPVEPRVAHPDPGGARAPRPGRRGARQGPELHGAPLDRDPGRSHRAQREVYWADTLGLLVWEEMPSAYRFTAQSVDRLTREWIDVLERDYSHPCVMAWVPFNEPWGVPNLPDNERERHWVEALYHLTRTLDSTRPVVGNDVWESVATDIIGIHDYDADAERIARRYHAEEVRPRLFQRERPGGRLLVLDGKTQTSDLPIILSELGGIALRRGVPGVWGYTLCDDARAFALAYESLLAAVRSVELLSGFCYTQFADTYQEANGLLYADRTPKFPLHEIAAATRGRVAGHPHPDCLGLRGREGPRQEGVVDPLVEDGG
ncbi:glycoside hydrolase family 2 TIM barrel-domain containing protein [Sorangium sp. So ce854]|uniref:glycoside hydrolase family 2 TIM barrel-domain containing protein n=1 Tax=Sorangium sp. So ce854 TaxID=3133322 RepID=UPI003F5DAEC0